MKKSPSSGFTLFELIIGIAVLAVLLGIAVPSFQETMRNNRIVNRTNELISAITFARHSADGGKSATICSANATLTACSGSNNWSNGWLVFIDSRTAGTIGTFDGAGAPPTDTMLQKSSINETGTVTVTGNASVMTFDPGGVRGGTNFTFDLAMTGCKGDAQRQVRVTAPGIGKISFVKVNCP